MTKTKRSRKIFTRSHKWLRRARRHFCGLLFNWALKEKDPVKFRQLVIKIGDRMLHHKLLSATCGHEAARWSCMSQWAKIRKLHWVDFRESDPRFQVAGMLNKSFNQWMAMKKSS